MIRYFLSATFLLCSVMTKAEDAGMVLKFTEAALDGDTVLHWTVQDYEVCGLVIQHYRWGGWHDLDTVKSSDPADFKFDVKKYMNAGENKFRVMAKSPTLLIYSKIVKVTSAKAPSGKDIKHHLGKKGTIIEFSREEFYEIYDKDSKVLMRGLSKSVDVKELKKGDYYINYGDISSEFSLN